MDLFKTGMKNTLKLLVVMAPVYWFVVDPIVNDWEETVIYKTFVYKPVKSNTDELSCNGSSLSDIACKGVKGANNFLDRVNEKLEIAEASRANPDNQYDSLEECLIDDSVMIKYTTREEWCDSFYVSIAENE